MTPELFVSIPIYEVQVKNPKTGEMDRLATYPEIVRYLQTQEALVRFPGVRAARKLVDPRGQKAAGLSRAPTLNVLTAMSLIGLARQRIMGDFYASGAPHALCLDADVHVEPETVGRMRYAMEHGADVVLCSYPGRTKPHSWMVGTLTLKDGKPDLKGAPRRVLEGHASGAFRLIQVLGSGFGCVMYSRRVYEVMAERFPELAYIAIPDSGPHGGIVATLERNTPAEIMEMARMDARFDTGMPRREFAFYTPEVRMQGGLPTFIGEDYAFFYRLKDAGLRCELLADAVVTHERYVSNLAVDEAEACS